MKRICSLVLWMVIAVSLQGCEIESDQNFHFVTLRILDAQVPESFELNEIYDIQVTYANPDRCTGFEGFDFFTVDETTRNIVAIGTVSADSNTACVQIVENFEASFQFEVLYTGTYTLRFYNGDDEEGNPIYLEYEVQVNAEEPTN